MPENFQRRSTLFGWTFEQWSLACGRYGIAELKTRGEASALRARWDREQNVEPGEIEFAGVVPPRSPRAAYDAFRLCIDG